MRVYGNKVRKTILGIRDDVDKICDEYLTKIYVKIKSYINNYPNTNWDKFRKDILKLYYDCLEEVYVYVSKSLKDLFKNIEPYQIKDIMDLTYQKDGKTLKERIDEYLDKSKDKLDSNEKTDDIILYLLTRYTIILTTETRMVEEAVKKNKKPIVESGNYIIQIIEGCGGECDGECLDYNGEYPEDEDIPWPPYHPNCTGIAYYDITDDPDDIHDLDLDESDTDDTDV